jgi:hypothetical protein
MGAVLRVVVFLFLNLLDECLLYGRGNLLVAAAYDNEIIKVAAHLTT